MNIIIPIGGTGTRFTEDGYKVPKAIIKCMGEPMLFWNIERLNISSDDELFIVYRDEYEKYNFESLVRNRFQNIKIYFIKIDFDTRGSSETVLQAIDIMEDSQLKQLTIVIDSDNFYSDDIISLSKNTNDNLVFYFKNDQDKPIYSYLKIDNDIVIDIKEKVKISDNACVGAYCFRSANLLKDTILSVIKDNKKDNKEFYISTLYKQLILNNDIVRSTKVNFTCLGTPNQLKSFCSNLNNSNKKYRFCFDLDNTLVTYPEVIGDYGTVKPIKNSIDFLNFLYKNGHTIIIYTARRMKTHSGNIGSVIADISKVTIESLEKFNIRYHELYFGKPYANFYIDDLAFRPFDDMYKETGFYDIHVDTRSHNKITINDADIIKNSTDISGEKYFYQNIPDKINNLFPKLIESGDNFIKIKKINGIPLSYLNVNGTLNEKNILDLLSTIGVIHNSSTSDMDIYGNYCRKLDSRVSKFDYKQYDNFNSIYKEVYEYLHIYEKENRGLCGVIHGDPVLTNVMLDVTSDSLKFIDMRGKIGDELSIYGDIFYDYAKIYQSIIGYDFILMNKKLNIDFINSNKMIFERFIHDKFGLDKMNDIKYITKSLVISLIPIHNNENCKEFYNLINNI